MKRLLGSLLVMILAGVIAQAQGNKIEQAVLSLEQQWEDALVKSDTAALEKLYSDKLVYTHSNASVDDKTSYITKIKSGASKYVSIKRDDIKVTVIGDTAIVTCHWLVQAVSGGNKINTDARYIHVYVKEKGGWKMAAHQSTYVVK
ncbi:MAG TPA: nuclear transport factor 2 family protein [Blastocatellia bacterium]|nr:nuclear transport factor 2 family protein [Blastocatellia bacterium]HMV82850.1 nuclear transport factor 2 family protein [Blastocatellia bacterium]HMY72997.1 nuclear transport factor 2 family protein [Blastocatellia bacterium]HMZ18774.1 nuclear transport factor 2 family protein [Blastocatellia bacterium]HNG29603.1 nuclear transport factor 2 family protein [Blastocatellia bacterium]